MHNITKFVSKALIANLILLLTIYNPLLANAGKCGCKKDYFYLAANAGISYTFAFKRLDQKR